jgi:hypothetical protein
MTKERAAVDFASVSDQQIPPETDIYEERQSDTRVVL